MSDKFEVMVDSLLDYYKIIVVNKQQENVWFKADSYDFVSLHKFLQFVLDSCSHPDEYTIMAEDWELDMPIYCALTGMYKRSFDERLHDRLTGTIPSVIIHDPVTGESSISKRKVGEKD